MELVDDYRIPFNRACWVGTEHQYIAEAVKRGHISGGGPATEACETLLQTTLGVSRAFLTTSCTHALELSAMLLDIQPGDEVVVPSFTFVSTVNAFVLRGARPVFCDIRPDTLNLDESCVEASIGPRTRAIVPVHYAGVGCEMTELLAVAGRHGIPIVEDNAHGLFATYRDRPLGTFGELATLSFHETKNFTCGEGGALLVNDPRFSERAEILRDKGTNRKKFLRGEVDKYTWVDIGSSYQPSDVLAAILLAQLEARDEIITKRRRVWNFYDHHLGAWAGERGVRLPTVPAHCEQSYHMYYLVLPTEADRNAVIDALKRVGILGVFHYVPLHLSEMGRRFGGQPGQCPVTEDVAPRLLRLPFFNDLSEAEQASVVEAVVSAPLAPTEPS